jgi:sugar lactone lactonase YvrE
MTLPSVAVLTLVVSSVAWGQTYAIDTFAGGSSAKIPGTSASLRGPQSVAVDAAGNVYFATQDNLVLRLDAAKSALVQVAGNLSAGFSGDNGPAIKAQLRHPTGVAVDAAGNLYIADSDNNRVRKVSGGVIATVAGGGNLLGDSGQATKAQLHSPTGVAVDAAGNLYIADSGDNRIRKVSPKGIITTVAGTGSPTPTFGGDNGPATSAQLNNPYGVAVDAAGSLYIAELGDDRIRKISGGVITTVVGNGTEGFAGDNGPATSAELCNPYGIAVDAAGALYIADFCNARIRKVANGTIATIAGNGTGGFGGDKGPATAAQLTIPEGVAVDAAGHVYIADTGNDRIRVLTYTAGGVSVLSALPKPQ